MDEDSVQHYDQIAEGPDPIARHNQNHYIRSVLVRLLRGLLTSVLVGSIFFFMVATPVEFFFWVVPPLALAICSCVAGLPIFVFTLVKFRNHWCYTGLCNGRSCLFLLELLACLPYGLIAAKTEVPVLTGFIWLRMLYFILILRWQKKLDGYLKRSTGIYCLLVFRIMKVVALDLFWVHIVAAVLYYTAVSQRSSEVSWLGSITTLGDIDFRHFESLPFWTRYSVSVYFAYITVSTVGYGDIHPQTLVELWVIQAIMIITAILAILSSYMGGRLIQDFRQQKKKYQQEVENVLLEKEQLALEEENRRIEEGRKRQELRHRSHLEELSKLLEQELTSMPTS